ncbi:MAG: response regulator transcription factor [Myxococcales bacterium]|nr:response regulator transcription factor [Myxococcales bacterium]
MVADDHDIVRKGFVRWLDQYDDMRVLAEARSGVEVMRLVEQLHPDVLILDIMMPGRDGLDIARDVCTRFSRTAVVVFTGFVDAYTAQRAFRAGAVGFVEKTAPVEDVVTAIRCVARGQRYIPRSLEAVFAQRYLGGGESDPLEAVTNREFQVLRYLAQGMTNGEIAEKLTISVRTVDGHRQNLLRKLQLRNNADLARFAIRVGLIQA